MYLIGVMVIFAWAFCLRCSEYTKCDHWDAPLVNQIELSVDKLGTKILKYKLDRRKNKQHEKIEPIAIPCYCKHFGVCGYCTIVKYIRKCNKYNIKSKYLFCYKNKGKWKPVSAATFRRILKKELLPKIFGKKYNPKIHRAHGFRYGGITDLGSIGVPLDLIRRISGHAPESKVLYHYLKLSPETVAKLISDNSKISKTIIKKLRKIRKRKNKSYKS